MWARGYGVVALLVVVVSAACVCVSAVREDGGGLVPEPAPRAKKLLVAVVSAPNHSKARKAIRETWGKDANELGASVKFFIGQIRRDEASRDELEASLALEPDVVRLDSFVESYHNLTAKSIAIFSYGAGKGYDGVMKVDDDTYLRVGKLKAVLDARQDWSNLWAGSFVRNNPVEKNPEGRWYAFDQYPHETWPMYPNGPGFFLGTSATHHIANNQGSLVRIRVDDAAVGVWLGGLSLDALDLRTSIFEYNPQSESNPANFEEMYRLHNGEQLTLAVCQDMDTGCLCSGHPSVSQEDQQRCWQGASVEPYTDKIPRHAHAL